MPAVTSLALPNLFWIRHKLTLYRVLFFGSFALKLEKS